MVSRTISASSCIIASTRPTPASPLAPCTLSATPADFRAADGHAAARLSSGRVGQTCRPPCVAGRPLPPKAVLVTFDDAYRCFAAHAWPDPADAVDTGTSSSCRPPIPMRRKRAFGGTPCIGHWPTGTTSRSWTDPTARCRWRHPISGGARSDSCPVTFAGTRSMKDCSCIETLLERCRSGPGRTRVGLGRTAPLATRGCRTLRRTRGAIRFWIGFRPMKRGVRSTRVAGTCGTNWASVRRYWPIRAVSPMPRWLRLSVSSAWRRPSPLAVAPTVCRLRSAASAADQRERRHDGRDAASPTEPRAATVQCVGGVNRMRGDQFALKPQATE